MESATLNEDWKVLLSMFPSNWRQLATDTSAMVRKLRSFPDEGVLPANLRDQHINFS